jgi:type VI secretion system protein ImpK
MATAAAQVSFSTAPEGAPGPGDSLPLIFQELFTVIVRVRSQRHNADRADAFRANVLALLARAEQDALKHGYASEDVRAAKFAVVAFLDESVLNSRSPVFADWVGRTLQNELFSTGQTAGELFFKGLDVLSARKDSPALADLLEVYYLCLLLGYRGRYSIGSSEELRSITQRAGQRIGEIRAGLPAVSAAVNTAPSQARSKDIWTRRLGWTAIALSVCAIVFFVAFKLLLNSGLSEISARLGQLR